MSLGRACPACHLLLQWRIPPFVRAFPHQLFTEQEFSRPFSTQVFLPVQDAKSVMAACYVSDCGGKEGSPQVLPSMSEIQQTPAQRAITVERKSTVIQGVSSVPRRHVPQSTDAPVAAYTSGTALATLSSSTHPVWFQLWSWILLTAFKSQRR